MFRAEGKETCNERIIKNIGCVSQICIGEISVSPWRYYTVRLAVVQGQRTGRVGEKDAAAKVAGLWKS